MDKKSIDVGDVIFQIYSSDLILISVKCEHFITQPLFRIVKKNTTFSGTIAPKNENEPRPPLLKLDFNLILFMMTRLWQKRILFMMTTRLWQKQILFMADTNTI